MSGRWGIETRAEGTVFRSRLEAKWAKLFTRIGWDWTYEPFDADGYIPDFLIQGPRPLVIEIKPWSDLDLLSNEADRVASRLDEGCGEVLALGADPRLKSGPNYFAGVTNRRLGAGNVPYVCPCSWVAACQRCKAVGVSSWDAWFEPDDGDLFGPSFRPCGHRGTLDWWHERQSPAADLVQIWREVGNEVQWKPRAHR